jgi:hypothetical protein
MKKFFAVLFVSIITQISLNAQIDIKSKVDSETYTKYSKAIDLFEQNVSSNDVVTLFIPNNSSLQRLGQVKYRSVFIDKNTSEVNSFINSHSTPTYLTNSFLNQKVIISNLGHTEVFKSNLKCNFVKNGAFVMLTDNLSFEANIENSLQLSSKMFIFFINGPIKTNF